MRTAAEQSDVPPPSASGRSDEPATGLRPMLWLKDWFTCLAASRSYWLLVLASAFVIGPAMLPVKWSGNEIVYFDLAFRSVMPDAFTDNHAMFDASHSRIVAMMAIGYVIKAFGFETAKTLLALVAWALYALGLGAVARALNMRLGPLAAALVVFLYAQQALVGGEWIFATVEPKVLAYICVFFGFAAALTQRWWVMVFLLVIGTYFHFLVGGAWVLLLLLLLAMDRPRFTFLSGLLGFYVLLVAPIVAVLVAERIGETVDTSSLPGTIDQIYATFRVSHQVAPFVNGLSGFNARWLPGLTLHAALAIMLFWSAALVEGRDRKLAIWAAVLNVLPLLATIAAFIDRDTHHLAKFLIFRPSSPILLVSCLLLARTHLPPPKSDRTALGASVLCLALALLIPSYLKAGAEIVRRPATARLLSQMNNQQRDITRFISQQTPKNAAILVEPSLSRQNSEADGFPLGLERLTGRGLIVFFKNVPSDTRDFVRWYKLLAASDAFFSGDCSQLSFLRADYVVVSSQYNLGAIGACTETVYQNEDYVVARTVRSP